MANVFNYVRCECGVLVTTNSLGRSAHRRGHYHRLMLAGRKDEAKKLLPRSPAVHPEGS